MHSIFSTLQITTKSSARGTVCLAPSGSPAASAELHIGRVLTWKSLHVAQAVWSPTTVRGSSLGGRNRHPAFGDKPQRPGILVLPPPLGGKPVCTRTFTIDQTSFCPLLQVASYFEAPSISKPQPEGCCQSSSNRKSGRKPVLIYLSQFSKDQDQPISSSRMTDQTIEAETTATFGEANPPFGRFSESSLQLPNQRPIMERGKRTPGAIKQAKHSSNISHGRRAADRKEPR